MKDRLAFVVLCAALVAFQFAAGQRFADDGHAWAWWVHVPAMVVFAGFGLVALFRPLKSLDVE